MIDTVASTITLPMKKYQKIIKHLERCIEKQRLGQKYVQKLSGLLRSVVITVPGGLGLFTALQPTLGQPRHIRMYAPPPPPKKHKTWYIRINDTHHRSVYMRDYSPFAYVDWYT